MLKTKKALALLLAILMLFTVVACNGRLPQEGMCIPATSQSDKETEDFFEVASTGPMDISSSFALMSISTSNLTIAFKKITDLTLGVGDTNRRSAVTTPAGGTVAYKSSNKSVATVDTTGNVTCKAVGKTVITATSGNQSASYNLTVVAKTSSSSSTASAVSSAKSEAVKVFAGYTVTVNDEKSPAVYSGGTDGKITTFYFFSADYKKLGSISGQAYLAIMEKYRVQKVKNGEWEAPNDDGDWSKWFADMFNAYRGLDGSSRKTTQDDQLEEFRYEVIRLTNLEREKAGLPAFEISERAMKYAQTRAEELATLYSHTRPDGSLGGTENIARRQISPEEVVKDWMNSSGHRKNILQPAPSDGYFSATHIGVGCYRSENGTLHWVQFFDLGPEFYK